MPERIHAPQVGSPDPEMKNSPLIEDTDYDYGLTAQTVAEIPAGCMFNGAQFADGTYICSGDELLKCAQGAWLRMGSCDPDNP